MPPDQQKTDDVVVVTNDNFAEFAARHQQGLAPEQPAPEAGRSNHQDPNEPTGDPGESEHAVDGEDDATLTEAERNGTGKPSRLQRRFGELAGARDGWKAKADQLERELAELRGAAGKPPGQVAKPPERPPPAVPAANDPAAAQPGQAGAPPGQQQQPQPNAHEDGPDPQQVRDQFLMRVGAQRVLTPDWHTVVEAASDVPTTPELTSALLESEQGPAIMYYLATHKADGVRIAGLRPSAMLREIGKLEAMLSAEPENNPEPATSGLERPTDDGASAPRRTTSASVRRAPPPPPISPVRNARSDASDELIDEHGNFRGTPEQWRALRSAGKV